MATLPEFIGRYQVIDRIGEGGMGALYLARDPAIDRLVAIKLLRYGFDSDEARARFSREARAAGRLHHPHVVTIFDVGEHEQNPFIAMEYLAGETVAQLIRQRARLTLVRKLKLVEELADGLAYAHRAGLVHRDIKPANLMVDAQGVLKILDFGIAQVEEAAMTQSGAVVGTLNYMSPEQISGGAVDHRSDIFSTGVVAYELLAYRQAFPGTIKEGLIDRILNARVAPLAVACPGLDSDVEEIVRRAMAPNPADRYQDLAWMRNDLARARQRLESQEQAETAYTEETTVFPAPPTPSGAATRALASGTHPELAQAEQALSTGQYHLALTLAGRTAAVDPDAADAGDIVHRAKRALLERARSEGAESASRPQTARTSTPTSAATGPPIDTAVPASASPAKRPIAIAAAVLAVLVFVIAAFFTWRRGDEAVTVTATSPSPPQVVSDTTPAPSPPSPPGASATLGAMDPVQEGTVPEPTPSAPSSEPAPQSATGAANASPNRAAAEERETDAMRRRARQEMSAARADRALATIETGLARQPADSELARMLRELLDEAARRTARARREAEAAGAAERAAASFDAAVGRSREAERLQQQRSNVDAIREYWSATALFAQAGAEARASAAREEAAGSPAESRPGAAVAAPQFPSATPPAASTPPTATTTPPALPSAAAGRGTDAPPSAPTAARSLDREAEETAVRKAIAAYRAAWERLDLAALRRVQALSASEAMRVQETMAAAREYEMEVSVAGVEIAPDAREAVVRATITRAFRPRIGSPSRQTVMSVIRLAKRDGAWTIVEVR